jgi:hypothetical protein
MPWYRGHGWGPARHEMLQEKKIIINNFLSFTFFEIYSCNISCLVGPQPMPRYRGYVWRASNQCLSTEAMSGGTPTNASVLRLWLGARQAWNVPGKKKKKIIKKNFEIISWNISCLASPQPMPQCRGYGWRPIKLEMFQELFDFK